MYFCAAAAWNCIMCDAHQHLTLPGLLHPCMLQACAALVLVSAAVAMAAPATPGVVPAASRCMVFAVMRHPTLHSPPPARQQACAAAPAALARASAALTASAAAQLGECRVQQAGCYKQQGLLRWPAFATSAQHGQCSAISGSGRHALCHVLLAGSVVWVMPGVVLAARRVTAVAIVLPSPPARSRLAWERLAAMAPAATAASAAAPMASAVQPWHHAALAARLVSCSQHSHEFAHVFCRRRELSVLLPACCSCRCNTC